MFVGWDNVDVVECCWCGIEVCKILDIVVDVVVDIVVVLILMMLRNIV